MNPTPNSPPSWLREPCPPWCVSPHREDDLLDDRVHDSRAQVIQVLSPDELGDSAGSLDEIILAAYKALGEHETWLYVGHPDSARGGLTMSRESAKRLAQSLSTFVEHLENATYKSVD